MMQLISLGAVEARNSGMNWISTEHILLGAKPSADDSIRSSLEELGWFDHLTLLCRELDPGEGSEETEGIVPSPAASNLASATMGFALAMGRSEPTYSDLMRTFLQFNSFDIARIVGTSSAAYDAERFPEMLAIFDLSPSNIAEDISGLRQRRDWIRYRVNPDAPDTVISQLLPLLEEVPNRWQISVEADSSIAIDVDPDIDFDSLIGEAGVVGRIERL